VNRQLRYLLAWFERFDRWLLFSVLVLALLGVVMVYTAGSFRQDSSTFYLVNHLARLGLGLVVMVLLAGLDYHRLGKPAVNSTIAVIGVGLLSLTVLLKATPLVASEGDIGRWLRLPFLPVQPVELAKVAVILLLARHCAGGLDRLGRDRGRLLWVLGVPGAAILILILQPNFGNALVFFVITLVLLWLSGLPRRWILGGLGLGLLAGVAGFFLSSKIHHRIVDWVQGLRGASPNYQVDQSLLGMGAGGWHGTGFGASHQRFAFLPEPHTDFIYAVVGEELGLIGALSTVFLFVLLIWRGYMIARRAGDDFGSLVAAGLTTMLFVYAAINLGMVTALLPVMGLPLPFVSYGGSALITNLAAVGILLSIDRHGREMRAINRNVLRGY
jgi:cell division protein FtsW